MNKKTLNFSSLKKIEGWLGFADYEIIKTLIRRQNEFVSGPLVEIGVHHGKSLILMAKFSNQDSLYAIDIFDDQKKNIDSSGLGDLKIFKRNLKKFEIDENRVIIDIRPSSEIKNIEIINKISYSRFFHIDGGHNYETVIQDIKLSTEVSSKKGIIAIDDVFRPEWPDVSKAAFKSEELLKKNFVCFAIGFNKSYFCNQMYLDRYRKILLENKSLLKFLQKQYDVKNTKTLIFQEYPLPEWNFKQIVWWFLSIYLPKFYIKLKYFLNK